MPTVRLMKKGVPFEWDEACQNAFDGIKAYLLNPPVLMSPIKALILYITAFEGSLGALLAQNHENGNDNSLYTI